MSKFRFFKFCKEIHTGSILADSMIWMSRLEYFRELERKRGPWIGDALENASGTSPERVEWNAADDPAGVQAMEKRFSPGPGGLKFGPGAKVSIYADPGAVRFTTLGPDYFIFSISGGDRDTLIRSMIYDAPEPHEACLALTTTVETLAYELYERGRLLTPRKIFIKDAFEKPEVGKIEYKTIIQPFGGFVPEPSPFKKDLRFRRQKEWRIAMKPFDDRAFRGDGVMIFIPKIRKMFVRIPV